MTAQDPVIARFVDELAASGVHGPTAATIGTFDGVHLGHQRLLHQTVEWAAERGAASLAITFDPHPRRIVHPDQPTPYLMPVRDRVELIRSLGVGHVALVTFSRELSQLDPVDFMQHLVATTGLKHLVAGPDFALGRGRSGTTDRLAEIGRSFGYDVEVVPPVIADGQIVSSTLIRELIQAGDVAAAAQLLGRPFTLPGVVVTGDQRGRTIGFPTANLAIEPDQVTPANGVYAVYARVEGQRHHAVMNIGVRPSFGLLQRTIEVHLLDFSGDLYGKPLVVDFIARLRAEQKFPSVDALVAQIRADIESARALFAAQA